jgi:hypothetical protein
MKRYGFVKSNEREQYALASHIWGHRLRDGQHWMEYMLEFLAVLAGFEYTFGRGLGDPNDPNQNKYQIPKRLGLRRFVFYDQREKTTDERDKQATERIRLKLRQQVQASDSSVDDLLNQLRSLLRSFSAIEDARSWYAKSLFPIHEELLLWEALRKGSTKQRYGGDAGRLEPTELDAGIEFLARNFFARGGEIYYLMISAGTEQNREQRSRIEQQLKHLLTERNSELGSIAQIINTAWDQHYHDPEQNIIKGSLGWLPDPECRLYQRFAEDLDCLLENSLDSLETLELLAHLICFHIICYIYHRAHPNSHSEGHASGSCLEACRPDLLIDLLDDEDGSVIRERSAQLLRRMHNWQIERARDTVQDRLLILADTCHPTYLPDDLFDETVKFFALSGKRKTTYQAAIAEAQATYQANATNRQRLIATMSSKLYEVLHSDFRTHFLPIHGKLGRAIGLVAPRRGPNPRYVLGDTLLKTLVFATLRPARALNFGEFLGTIYQRYGIIVGPGEAREAGLSERLRINEEYYIRNRQALLQRMQCAGLVTQYSDATALVRRP